MSKSRSERLKQFANGEAAESRREGKEREDGGADDGDLGGRFVSAVVGWRSRR